MAFLVGRHGGLVALVVGPLYERLEALAEPEAVHHLQRVGPDREEDGVEGGVDDGEAHLAQGGDAAHAAQDLRQHVDDDVAPHVEPVPVGLVGHAARVLEEGVELGAQAAHVEQHVHQQVAELGREVLHDGDHAPPVVDDVPPVERLVAGQREEQAVDEDVGRVEEEQRHGVDDVPAALQRQVDGGDGRGGAPVQQRQVVGLDDGGGGRAGRGRHGGVEVGHGAVDELAVAHVPHGRLVQEGLERAGRGPARQAVGLLHEGLGLADGGAQPVQLRVDQAHVHGGHDAGVVARERADLAVARGEAVRPPVGLGDVPVARPCLQLGGGVAEDPVPGGPRGRARLGGGVEGRVEEEPGGVPQQRGHEPLAGPRGEVEAGVAQHAHQVRGGGPGGGHAERDPEAGLGLDGPAGAADEGRRRGALGAPGPGLLDRLHHGGQGGGLLLAQRLAGPVLARHEDGGVGLGLLDAPGGGELGDDGGVERRRPARVAHAAGVQRGGAGDLEERARALVAVLEGPQAVEHVALEVELV